MLGSVARAQKAPQQFVVSGKAAEKVQDFTTINRGTAERIVDACEEAATAYGGGVHSQSPRDLRIRVTGSGHELAMGDRDR